MKKISYTSMLFVLVVTAFALGCENGMTTAANKIANTAAPAAKNNTNEAASPVATPTDDAPRITLAEAKAAFDAGSAIFVDTRAEAAYKPEHIKGAINITQDKLESKLSSLSKDKKIIAYCS